MREYNIEPIERCRRMIMCSRSTPRRAPAARPSCATAVTCSHERARRPALTHGQRLPADLMRPAARGRCRDRATSICFAVAAGPGSFTGLRVGIATMQGLAMARGTDGRAGLDARSARARAAPDARRRRRGVDGRAARRGLRGAATSADGRDRLARSDGAAAATHAGARRDALGCRRVRVHRRRRRPLRRRRFAAAGDRARGRSRRRRCWPASIGAIAADATRSARSLPHAVVPLYVRRPDAELARDRRAVVAAGDASRRRARSNA